MVSGVTLSAPTGSATGGDPPGSLLDPASYLAAFMHPATPSPAAASSAAASSASSADAAASSATATGGDWFSSILGAATKFLGGLSGEATGVPTEANPTAQVGAAVGDWLGSFFVRGFLILVGLVIVAYGLWHLAGKPSIPIGALAVE